MLDIQKYPALRTDVRTDERTDAHIRKIVEGSGALQTNRRIFEEIQRDLEGSSRSGKLQGLQTQPETFWD